MVIRRYEELARKPPDTPAWSPRMMNPAKVVSIHPYFRIHPGKQDEVRSILAELIRRTATEEQNLYYDFTLSDDVLFCREAYVGAEGLLKHLENVTDSLGQMLKIADLIRVEVHGAGAELEKLKTPLADLKPQWFVFECGVER
jgi:quinol monooxygenase YgiN